VDNHDFVGRNVSGRTIKIQSRYECCARSLMWPMMQRMIDDGITLIIRGQRDDEYVKPPMRSGQTSPEGFEVLYPIQSWTGDQVSTYLCDNQLPLADFYSSGARRAPECMGCTAWWDEGRSTYLKNKYPKQHAVLLRDLGAIKQEIDIQYNFLKGEML